MTNEASEGARTKRQTERLPPFDAAAETAVLGCCMMDNTKIGVVIEACKGDYAIFYDLRNRTIFETLTAIYEDREAADAITLSYRLKAFDQLERVGGLTYLSALEKDVPSAENVEYYLRILNDCWLRRKMIAAASEVMSTMYESSANLEEALDVCERDILRVSESRVTQQQDTVRTIVQQAMREIEQSLENRGEPTGLSTGFSDMDRKTDGLHAGEMIVIAGRPGTGKSSLIMNIAESVAVAQRIPVGVFSLEMTKVELMKRMVCSRARVNLRNVQEGFLAERDFPKLANAAGQIMSSPLYIDDEGGLSILQVRAKARRMWQQFGIKLFIIDYLQLMHGLRAENRAQEVAQVSNGIKNLAKELGVPIIAAAQLNREIEREKNRRPRLADLKESGGIEQDADVVGMLYRRGNDSDEDDDPNATDVQMNLLIAKQRAGPTGDLYFVFRKAFTRFELAAKVADEDVPAPTQQQEFQS